MLWSLLSKKESNLYQIQKKNIDDYNKKKADEELKQDENRKMQLMNTHNTIKTQMQEKSKLRKLGDELGQIEVQRTSDRIYEINSFDQMLKDDKKKRQEMYKQMLNSQIQYKNGIKSFGNMTQVEKQMNKDDLKAYKVYNNNQHALIPGINNEKRFLKRDELKPKQNTSYEENQRRLENYGYGRYLRKTPTAGPIENYNAPANQSRIITENNMNRSYTGNAQAPFNIEGGAVPNSRRNMQQSPRNIAQSALRNAGANSMIQDLGEKRAAGSPSGVNPYRSQIL